MLKRSARLVVLVVVALVLATLAPVAAGTSSPAHRSDSLEGVRDAMNRRHDGSGATGGAYRPDGRGISVVGHSDLGGGGLNSDVWAYGNFAYVGTWGAGPDACPATGTKVINIANPSRPTVTSVLPAPSNTRTNDVKVAKVSTGYFSGALAVISNEDCAETGARGFELWDVTRPNNAKFLGRWGPEVTLPFPADDEEPSPEFVEQLSTYGFGVHNTFIFRSGKRVYVAAVVNASEIVQSVFGQPFVGDLRIIDVTNPHDPVQVADWSPTVHLGTDPFGGFGDDYASNTLHDVWVEGRTLYASWWDLGLMLFDVSDPTSPSLIGRATYDSTTEEGNTHVAVPGRGGNLVVVGDEDFSGAPWSSQTLPWGFLRIFDTRDPSNPVEVGRFATNDARNTLGSDPAGNYIGDFSAHNVIVKGNTVYASWYSNGLVVIDISDPTRPREVASWAPPAAPDPFGVLPTAAEVWGVYVHRGKVLISDMNSGLWVLAVR